MSPTPLTDIRHFIPLTESIATAGQPTAAQFATIREAGYEVVVNLALPTSTHALPNEQSLVEAEGMVYVHIPVEWEAPAVEQVEEFFATLQANTDRKVFVHCAMNMRVSAFMYLYRRLYQQIDESQAQAEMQQIWTPNETWQRLLERVMAEHSVQHGESIA